MFQMCHLFYLRPLCFCFGRHSKQLTPIHSMSLVILLSVLLGRDYHLHISSVDIKLLKCKQAFKDVVFLNTKANSQITQN